MLQCTPSKCSDSLLKCLTELPHARELAGLHRPLLEGCSKKLLVEKSSLFTGIPATSAHFSFLAAFSVILKVSHAITFGRRRARMRYLTTSRAISIWSKSKEPTGSKEEFQNLKKLMLISVGSEQRALCHHSIEKFVPTDPRTFRPGPLPP